MRKLVIVKKCFICGFHFHCRKRHRNGEECKKFSNWGCNNRKKFLYKFHIASPTWMACEVKLIKRYKHFCVIKIHFSPFSKPRACTIFDAPEFPRKKSHVVSSCIVLEEWRQRFGPIRFLDFTNSNQCFFYPCLQVHSGPVLEFEFFEKLIA